jgi:uncharacterized protein (DUF58 family)
VLGFGERLLTDNERQGLTIYPRVVPLEQLGLPASLPYGTIGSHQRLFSDPSRLIGVRPYQPSDGVRRIDWKTTARTGTPVVRRYQPAIALEALVGLAFARNEYSGRNAYDTMERALTAAASIAVWLSQHGQQVGLSCTGIDPLDGTIAPSVVVGHGQPHLNSVLGVLGRLQPTNDDVLLKHLLRAAARLGWGSTVVVIVGRADLDLVSALLSLRQRGLNVVLVVAEPQPDEIARARRHGIYASTLTSEGYLPNGQY